MTRVLRDSAGTEMAYPEVRARARAYIVRHGSLHDIVDAYLDGLDDDDLLQWVVAPAGDPDSGLFVMDELS